MVATSGDRLLQHEAEESLRQDILPLATVVTPNLAETEVLVGRKVASLEEMRAAAEQIVAGGARAGGEGRPRHHEGYGCVLRRQPHGTVAE